MSPPFRNTFVYGFWGGRTPFLRYLARDGSGDAQHQHDSLMRRPTRSLAASLRHRGSPPPNTNPPMVHVFMIVRTFRGSGEHDCVLNRNESPLMMTAGSGFVCTSGRTDGDQRTVRRLPIVRWSSLACTLCTFLTFLT